MILLKKVPALVTYQIARVRDRPSLLPYAFIVGAPRSRTALVQALVSAHPRAMSLERETGFFRPDFLHRVKRWPAADRARASLAGKPLVTAFEDMAQRQLAETQTDLFIEKTPQHIKSMPFILRMFPKPRILHVFRDPRDSFASARGHPHIRYTTPEPYGAYWKSCLGARLALGRRDAILDVSYEDICKAPDREIARIFAFRCLAPLDDRQLQNLSETHDDRRARFAHFQQVSGKIDTSSIRKYTGILTDTEAKAVMNTCTPAYARMLDLYAGAAYNAR